MYYELYIDSLFLVNFVMNLYLLMLVNHTARRTATRLRLVAGAALGAAVYCISFILPYAPVWMKLLAGTAAVSIAMVGIAFRPAGAEAYFKLIESLIGYSFIMGGAFFFLLGRPGPLRDGLVGMAGILGVGGILYMVISFIKEYWKRRKSDFCKVTLVNNDTRVTVRALLDTGNGLVEPISGKPVSVADKKIVESLWQKGLPEGFRAIPYHSVGCSKGIMKGYEAPEMIVEYEGIRYIFHHVYLGVGEEAAASMKEYGMILNPRLLEGEKKHDTKSGDTGKHTVQNDSQGKKLSHT